MPCCKNTVSVHVILQLWTLLSVFGCVCCNESHKENPTTSSSSSSSSSGSPVAVYLQQGAYNGQEQISQVIISRNGAQASNHKGGDGSGFPGGKPPTYPRCTTIPGCRFCPTGPCTSCYYNFGGSRFQLRNGICRCPPGFGALTNTTDSDTAPGLDLVWWANRCKPCPAGTKSPGGPIETATCQPCQDLFTSLPASAECTIRTNCQAGQQPNDSGNCVPCRIGTYQNAPSTRVCKLCPVGYTTVSTGSTSIGDCIVPVCAAGQELTTFRTGPNAGLQFWCQDCTGIEISKAGTVEQGTRQPSCEECTLPAVPTPDRTTCAFNICPPPDAFSISCTAATAAARTCPSAAVRPRTVFLGALCTAEPEGAVITWYKATSCTSITSCTFNYNNPLQPPLATCPIDDIEDDTDPYAPFITSFNGRTDCLCEEGEVNCNFETGVVSQADFKPFTTGTPYVLITD